jgi:hypothetical protein
MRRGLFFAAILPAAVGCNSILGIGSHPVAPPAEAYDGGTIYGMSCSADAAANDAGGAAPGTTCGFVMPNPASSDLPNPAKYRSNPGDGTVSDLVTGLTWEGTVDPASYRRDDAIQYCAAKGAGWRLPTRIELDSLVDFTVSDPNPFAMPLPTNWQPTINPIFSNTPPARFWTSSHTACDPTAAWEVDFSYGHTRQKPVTDAYRVRCVHNAASVCPPTRFQVQADQVHDSATGLTWQQAVEQNLTWDAAMKACPDGWRLPSLVELQTIVDETVQNPAIDGAFMNTPALNGFFWTSSPYVGDRTYAWYVTFIHGHSDIQSVDIPSYVRCVRWDGTP